MAKFGGRSYKKKANKKGKKAEEDEDEDEDEEEERPRKKGKGRKGKGGDSDFIHVTGLFKSDSGKSWTVFIKDDMLEKLQDLEEDDLLGVSKSDYGMSLWIRKAD